jgi:tetratricopeptide (TPR) repeat protein
MRKRGRNLFLAALMGTGFSVSRPARAETPQDKIARWEQSIARASEAGNFSTTQAQRRQLAAYCASIGDYATAAKHYELLLASRPGKRERVSYFVQLGKMRDALKDYARAINAYQDALHDEPKDYEATLALARSYDKVDLSSKAVERYQKCIALNPKDVEPRLEIAGVYAKVGYLNRAIAAYKKAIALTPRQEAYLGMADCYVREDDVAHATEILEQGKTVLPQAEYDVHLGDIYHRQGNGEKAVAAWEDALRQDPKRDDVRLKLVLLYDRLHKVRDTDRLMEPLLKQYPASPLVHFLRAWILYGRGDRQGSRREALAVQQLAPTEVVQHYNERLLGLLNK